MVHGAEGYAVYREWDGPCPSCQVADEEEGEGYRQCSTCGFDSEEEDVLDDEEE